MKLRGNNLVSTQNFNSAYASFLRSHVAFVTFHTFTFHLELLLFYLNFYICHFSHFYSNVTAIVRCPSPFVTFSTSINLTSIQFVVDPIPATKLNSNVNSSLPSAQPKVNLSRLTSSSRWNHSFHFVLHFHQC